MEETRDHLPTPVLPEPRDLLRRHGLRCTPGRVRLLALLRASERHLSTAEACARLAQAGTAIHATTVYRTLEALTAVGVTHAVPGPGPTRYGITAGPHHHTVCQQCGQVAALASEHLTEAAARIEELTGLRPDASGSLGLRPVRRVRHLSPLSAAHGAPWRPERA